MWFKHWSVPLFVFVLMAASVLAAALIWAVPMMLWDHIDLIPFLRAYDAGQLRLATLAEIHGGHSHIAAYLVLLASTLLSAGNPLADVVVSWLWLVIATTLILHCVASAARREASAGCSMPSWLTVLALVMLSPAHLVNLQWGCKVAVFLCLTGLALSCAAVILDWSLTRRAVVGAVGLTLALASFATGLAVLPVMLLALLLRKDLNPTERSVLGMTWVAVFIILARWLQFFSVANSGSVAWSDLPRVIYYAVNYLAGGIARFATGLAIPIVLLGTVILLASMYRAWRTQPLLALLWLMLALFAVGSALLTAFGRAQPFGPDHAFVSRYASFSLLFWLAVFGAWLTRRPGQGPKLRWMSVSVGILGFLFAVNTLHIGKKAITTHAQAEQIKQSIAASWPHIDPTLLQAIHWGAPAETQQRLQYLKDKAYPPFQPSGAGR